MYSQCKTAIFYEWLLSGYTSWYKPVLMCDLVANWQHFLTKTWVNSIKWPFEVFTLEIFVAVVVAVAAVAVAAVIREVEKWGHG